MIDVSLVISWLALFSGIVLTCIYVFSWDKFLNSWPDLLKEAGAQEKTIKLFKKLSPSKVPRKTYGFWGGAMLAYGILALLQHY
ncbi:MAG: hypothetical protein MJA83_18790 [Gammaproteobacteria bacterium]|nr:hypothetical protein [Gammaproteobacteria bacterium]